MSALRITLPSGARVEMQSDGRSHTLVIGGVDDVKLAEAMLRLALELMSKQAKQRRDCGENCG